MDKADLTGTLAVAAASVTAIAMFVSVMVRRNRADRDECTRRAFRRAPSLIRDVRDGALVVVVGEVSCDQPVTAYQSQRPCVFFECVTEHDPDNGPWVETERTLAGADFCVTDSSGDAIVRVEGAEALLMKDKQWQDDSYSAWRKREAILGAGDRVAVFGRGSWEPDPRPSQISGYRERPTVLVLRGTRRHTLRLTTSPPILARRAEPRGRVEPDA